MEIRIRETGAVVNEREFRELHENVSFPAVLDTTTLNDYGADVVLEAPAPTTTTYQTAQRNGVVQDALGNWVWAWMIRDWTQEEIDAYNQKKALETQTEASRQIQLLLDNTALEHGYDSIISLCTYSNSTNAKWASEGQYGCNFRDACWSKAEEIQDAVIAGNWPTTGAGQLPTVAQVLAEMPAVSWPIN